MSRRTLVAVLGCHRSGTSATAGTLAQLGFHLGPELMPPSPANPRGYWESLPVVRAHEQLLRRWGTTWDCEQPPKHRTRDWGAAVARKQLLTVLEQCEGDAFALKDPRMCLFPELWLEVCGLANVELVPLYVSRQAGAIVQSMQKRDAFTQAHARAVARAYIAGQHRWVQLAGIGYGVTYEDLLADWRTAFGREFLERFEVSTERAEAVLSFLAPELNHA